jgi:hypothetical protein
VRSSLNSANSLCYVPLTFFSPKGVRATPLFSNTYGLASPVTTSVIYHLREFIKMPQKSHSVFYHLQTIKSVSTFIMYHLRKKPGGGLRQQFNHRGICHSPLSSALAPTRPCIAILQRDSCVSRYCAGSMYFNQRAARPCLSPLGAHSYEKTGGT